MGRVSGKGENKQRVMACRARALSPFVSGCVDFELQRLTIQVRRMRVGFMSS